MDADNNSKILRFPHRLATCRGCKTLYRLPPPGYCADCRHWYRLSVEHQRNVAALREVGQ